MERLTLPHCGEIDTVRRIKRVILPWMKEYCIGLPYLTVPREYLGLRINKNNQGGLR